MKIYAGIGVSRGINIAPVFQFRHASLEYRTYRPADPKAELERLEAAVLETKEQLERIYEKAVDQVGTDEAAIFHAHIMILQDPDMQAGVRERILDRSMNAEAALFEVTEEYCRVLEEIEDDYLRARVVDIRDVRDSLLRILLEVNEDNQHEISAPSIIVSNDLAPSDCISLPKKLIMGFCTVEGGATSHTAILARSLGVPAIAGVPGEVTGLDSGSTVILDGFRGELIAEADENTLQTYRQKREQKLQAANSALQEADQPAVTRDGRKIDVFVNLGSDNLEDLEQTLRHGAEGVGLLRTEFIYLDCQEMPDEEYQYEKYRTFASVFREKPVILRTLDIGGDKQLPYLDLPHELNPFLGVRGLRLCLRNPDLFKTQLRAALRASAHGNLQVMFPMVTKVSEVRQARSLLEECRLELQEEGHALPERVEVGIMIEIPAAALLADHLAKEVDFFSIGTNDLSQYTLAVDRTNATLANLANAFDPAVLLLVRNVVRAGHEHGKQVGICGELAGDPLAIPILVGLELDKLSMNLPAVPVAKQIIRRLNFAETKELAERVLQLETPEQVRECVHERMPFLADEL